MRFTGQYYDGGVANAGSKTDIIRGNRWKVNNYMKRFVTQDAGVDETRVTDRAGKIRLSLSYTAVAAAGGFSEPTPPPPPPVPVNEPPDEPNPDNDNI